jgi:twitching motility two-component system response regulator PilH
MPPTITPPRVAPPVASKRKPGGRGSWKTALVVDPDADNRKRVIRLLRQAAGELDLGPERSEGVGARAGAAEHGPSPARQREKSAGESAEPAEAEPSKTPEQRLAIHEAENGSAAWALIEVVKPDLIVAEILLEGLSGLQLLRRLRDKYGKQAPVVFFVTEMSNEVDRYWALRNGAGAYVIKPYEDEFLRKRSAKLFDEGDEGGLELDSWPIGP